MTNKLRCVIVLFLWNTCAALELLNVYMKPDLIATVTACSAKNCFARNCKGAIDGVYELGKCTNISGCMAGDDKTKVQSVVIMKQLESEKTTSDITSKVKNTEAWGEAYDQNNKFTYTIRMFQLPDCQIDDDNAELTSETLDQDVYGHGGTGIRVGPNAASNGASFYTTTVPPHDYEMKMRGVVSYWSRIVGLVALLSFMSLTSIVALILFTIWTSKNVRMMCSALCNKLSVSENLKKNKVNVDGDVEFLRKMERGIVGEKEKDHTKKITCKPASRHLEVPLKQGKLAQKHPSKASMVETGSNNNTEVAKENLNLEVKPNFEDGNINMDDDAESLSLGSEIVAKLRPPAQGAAKFRGSNGKQNV